VVLKQSFDTGKRAAAYALVDASQKTRSSTPEVSVDREVHLGIRRTSRVSRASTNSRQQRSIGRLMGSSHPVCDNHKSCRNIFALTTIGPIQPRGSKIRDIQDSTTLFVIGLPPGSGGVNSKRNSSLAGLHITPNILAGCPRSTGWVDEAAASVVPNGR
jgi:hypothetical protein